MFDIEELARSLPVPGRDEKPPERVLTKAEIEEIRAKKPTRTRHNWSNPAEQMMCRILEGAFGARNVKREADRMQGWQDAEGEWHYNYANRGKPDITFAALFNGELVDGAMEVKSVAPKSSGLSLDVTNIKRHQVAAMDKHKGLACWGLVFWEKRGVARCFVVPHADFMDIINARIKERIGSGFKGRSIRRKKDLDLLEPYEVLKSNRWYLPDECWFRRKG